LQRELRGEPSTNPPFAADDDVDDEEYDPDDDWSPSRRSR
jgi:hypothetical protein